MTTRTILAFSLATLLPGLVAAEEHPGKALYEKHCEICHGGTVSKAPQISLLQIMSASSVFRAQENGVMQEQAAALSTEEGSR